MIASLQCSFKDVCPHLTRIKCVFIASVTTRFLAKKHTEAAGSKAKTYIKVFPRQIFSNYRIINNDNKRKKTQKNN